MELRVEQGCPQCGAPVTLSETGRLLTCPYCGVRNFLRSGSTLRYVLPDRVEQAQRRYLLYAPYLRLKSTVYAVSESGIAYRIIDTTQLGHSLPGLPPTLGMRPQAMKLARVTRETGGRFLRMSVKARSIIEKTDLPGMWSGKIGRSLYHRAYIGDMVSLIYLPLARDESHLIDGVTDNPLIELERLRSFPLEGFPFNPRWQIRFLPTLCPRCGWSLDGEEDCLVLTCSNCDTAWEIGDHGLRRVEWLVQPGPSGTALYLPFWKTSAAVPALEIFSFADFIERSNQPLVPRPQWRDRTMSFWVPAFKLRPDMFLRLARRVTVSQWRLQPDAGHVVPDLHPVTLPASEAGQAIRITLAASAVSPKNIHPFLPEARIRIGDQALAHLPFTDKGHDWVQPHTGAVVAKSILHFGRRL